MIAELILQAARSGVYLYVEQGRLAFKAQKGAMSAALKAQIADNKDAIIAHLQNQQADSLVLPAISKKTDGLELIPLSYAQQSLWLLDNIEQGTPQYNIPFMFKLEGQLSFSALNQAFNAVIERHHSLRTAFVVDESAQPKQRIRQMTPFSLTSYDYRHLSGAALEAALAELAKAEAGHVFDLRNELLFRGQLVELGEQQYVLLLNMHHIVSDGWSVGVLMNEFSHWYRHFSDGSVAALPPLAIQYGDYAMWQRAYFAGELYQQHLSYWTTQLAGLPLVHSLPTDFARPKEQSYAGAVYREPLAKTLAEPFKALCQRAGASAFMGFHTLLTVLLSRWSNEQDIVIGTPVSNREQPEIAQSIGYFVNTVVLRTDVSAATDFLSLLAQNKQVMLAAMAHQLVPFEQVVESLQPKRDLSFSPLFQIMLSYTGNEQPGIELPNLTVSGIEQPATTTKYDFTLNVLETNEGLILEWQYAKGLFAASTIERISRYFVTLLEGVLNNSKANVMTLNLLPADERATLLANSLGPKTDFCENLYVHEVFDRQVKRYPQAIALAFADQTLSYQQLNERAETLAVYLQAQGLVPNQLVAICFERAIDMVVSLLAILKTGCAYVPLDSKYPEDRLGFMLSDAKPRIVLTQAKLLQKLSSLVSQEMTLVAVDSQWREIEREVTAKGPLAPISAPAGEGAKGNQLAYMMYTSGSTGQPKGVMVEHRSINRLVLNTNYIDISERDVVLQFSSISFDVATFEIWGALLNGAKLVLAPNGDDVIAQVGELIKAQKISVLWLTSGLFQLLVKDHLDKLSGLRVLLAGGDVVPLDTTKRFLAHCQGVQFVNGYGPTENTTFTACHVVTGELEDNLKSLPIGKPIANTQVYLLDQNQQLVPVGVPGELHACGDGVARGYFNRPELSAEKFVPNPFETGGLMYKTGDMARWLADGTIEFLGRKDTQVKIRGFRIELEEIEAQLNRHPEIKDSVVIAIAQANNKYLVAFYVAHQPAEVLASEALKAHLQQHLPEFMLPAAYVGLEAIPLTPNGKVNRNALMAMEVAFESSQRYVAPRSEHEQQLVAIWAEVLGIAQDSIGINDNFFELGGHSLLVIQLLPKLQALGMHLSARQLFLTPTIAALASALAADSQTPFVPFKAPENAIPPDCQHITPAMLPLVSLDEKALALITAQVPGGASNIQDIYPLGPLQQGILFHHMMSTEVDPYVLPLLFKVKSKKAVDGFLSALEFVVARHEALRAQVLWQGLEQPVQVVRREVELAVTWLQGEQDSTPLAQMKALCVPQAQYMSLSQAPLFDIKLMADSDTDSGQYLMLLRFHHVISDHVGLEILLREIAAFEAGEAQRLPAPVPYREFIAYTQQQQSQLDASAYFSEQFGDVDEPTLAFNLLNVQGDGSGVNELRQAITNDLNDQLRAVAKRLNVSPAVIFHSAWAILVSACSGRNDVVFGTVMSGRLQGMQGAQATVGVFMNTLPLRIKLADMSASRLVRQVKVALAELLPYEQTSLALAQRCSALPGDTPLFNAMLNYRHSRAEDIDAKADSDFELIQGQERTNFPLSLAVDELGNGFELTLQSDVSLSAERVMNYMLCALSALVACLQREPQTPVSKVSVLPAIEKDMLLEEFNATKADYAKTACLHQLFEAQVAKTPDATALVCLDARQSYASLNAKANQLAHYLVTEHQLQPDSLVGICLERSFDMVVAILAVLKAGGAYVPMDPDYPEARLSYMLEDSGLSTVLTDTRLLETLPLLKPHSVCLDKLLAKENWATQPSTNLEAQVSVTAQHLAYVIYTSGSTGNPKGVMVEHQSVVNFLSSMAKTPGINADDKLLAVTSTAFDIHVLELFLPLLSGAQLVLASKPQTLDAKALMALMSAEDISVMQATPATWKMLLEAGWQVQRPLKVLCGGEALSDTLAQGLLAQQSIALWNMYGPTETTIWSAVKQILPQDGQVTLGAPIANTQFYVVNEALSLLPVGVPGELLIGGDGLARGYLANAALTEAQFIANPFYDPAKPGSSKRLYRTGDLVCWLPYGQLKYLGRADQQVKIRGFRVECGEVENQLRRCNGVKDAVVVAHKSAAGDSQLLCYFVGEKAQTPLSPPSFSLFYFGAQHSLKDDVYGFYLNSGKYADANGFEAIWTPERHFDPVGALYPNPSLLSAALAAVTDKVHLRSGSVVMPLHDPIRVAEEWSVVDNLSQGRVGLAIASGWHSRDFVLNPDNFAQRKACVIEGLQTIKTLWQGKRVTRTDGQQNPVEIELFPKPVQSQLPIWMTAAGNPNTFIEAGRLGANLLTHLLGQTIEEVSANISLYRDSLAKHGYDPAKGKVTLMVHTYLADDLEQALDNARQPFINYMRAHVALVKPLLAGLGITDEQIAEVDEDSMLSFAYHRYTQSAALIGTVESVLPTLEKIACEGVNEVACLIDWMDEDLAFAGLPFISELMQRAQTLNLAAESMEKDLRHQLHAKLPHYMVPGAFFQLDVLPLTPNGKIDRKALPLPDAIERQRYIAPKTDTQQRLSALWSEVLAVEQVGLHDNFFQLGGHSLLAMKLQSKLKEAFNVDFAVDLFFELTDLESFAAYIDSATAITTENFNFVSSADDEEMMDTENFTI